MAKLVKEDLCCYDAESGQCYYEMGFVSKEDYEYYCRNCTGTDNSQ